MRCNFSTASVFPTTLACIFRAQHGAHSIHSYGMNQWNVIKHVLCNSAWQRDFQSFLPGHSRLHSTDKKKHLVSLPPKHIVNTVWTLPSVICEVSPWLRGNGSWLVAVHGSIRLGSLIKLPPVLHPSEEWQRPAISQQHWVSLSPATSKGRVTESLQSEIWIQTPNTHAKEGDINCCQVNISVTGQNSGVLE